VIAVPGECCCATVFARCRDETEGIDGFPLCFCVSFLFLFVVLSPLVSVLFIRMYHDLDRRVVGYSCQSLFVL